MEVKLSKEKVRNKTKKTKYSAVFVIFLIIIIIYAVYSIFELVKEPTNIFVVENGQISLEEETVRLYYKK